MNVPRPLRRALAGVAAAAVLLLTGCGVSIPTSGAIVDTQPVPQPATDEGFSIVPRPPQPGASPTEIVQGFLDAMQATPLSTTVARKFLAANLSSSWNPQEETITYADTLPPRGTGTVSVELEDAVHLDAQGRWLGALPARQRHLRFQVVKEHGQWRISRAPNALIVPTSWFQSRFSQMSLYFFDPTGRILVPEPVFVPNGSQLVTALVRDLAAGPAPALAKVEQTFLPSGIDPGLSVPVDANGTAQIDLSGNVGSIDSETLRMLTAQLSWTLSQDSAVKALHITVGSRPAQLQDSGGTTVSLPTDLAYDPAGLGADRRVFGLRKGVVVVRTGAAFVPVPGDLGSTRRSSRSVGVDLAATEAAVVSADGRKALVEPLATQAHPSSRTVITGTDLLKPAWDADGDLWLVDRTSRGAVVRVAPPSAQASGTRHATVVDVPGVSGQDVRSFVISRDGSRLVAVVRGRTSDAVVVSRLERDGSGKVLGATRAGRILAGSGQRFEGLAWRSPTSVVALQDYTGGALLHTISIDGSSDTVTAATGLLLVDDRLDSIVGTPVAGDPLYGLSGDTMVDVTDETLVPTHRGVLSAITYVG